MTEQAKEYADLGTNGGRRSDNNLVNIKKCRRSEIMRQMQGNVLCAWVLTTKGRPKTG
jgi:hypothetical protein